MKDLKVTMKDIAKSCREGFPLYNMGRDDAILFFFSVVIAIVAAIASYYIITTDVFPTCYFDISRYP